MNSETIVSAAMLFAIAVVGTFGAWRLVSRLRSSAWAGTLVVFFWLGWFVSIFFIDADVPFAESHFRPGAEAVPVWLVVLAFVVRFGALGASGGWAARRRRKTHA